MQDGAIRQLGNLSIQRIVEMEIPFLPFEEIFVGVGAEELAPYRAWLEPWSLSPACGRFNFAFQSYLVRTSRHTILIDSCVGCDKSYHWGPFHKRTDRTWLANLAAAGVAPPEVDFVLCTHLHVDHCGWNTQLVDGRWVPTFPNATYIVSRPEYEASQVQADSVYRESVLPIVEAGQALLVDMDHGLDDEVRLEPTPGHTPGHVAVRLASRGEEAVMTGDLIHCPVQCRRPDWHCRFDTDPVQAAATRQAVLERACAEASLVLTAHFPSPSVGHILPAEPGFELRYG